ncbi:hypothetical protein AALB64_16095 [Lachnospiraceae bacterium 45-P1]
MKKQNMPLATEILREQIKKTRLWRTAFIVTFAVVVVDRIVGKAGWRSDGE